MATISNGREGEARLAVDIDIVRAEHRPGLVYRGCVALNSCLGLLWAHVTFTVGRRETFCQEVLLQSDNLREFADGVVGLLRGQTGEVALDIGSPELGLQLRRHDLPPRRAGGARLAGTPRAERPNASPRLSLLAYVDIGVQAGAESVSRAGPAMLLEPSVEEARQFGRDLRSETELALCL
jgi:hypothetical protein